MIRFITFGTEGFERPMRTLLQSAESFGADETRAWTRQDLVELPIYRENRGILDAPRGAGYWAWKPIIIAEELRRMRAGEVLIYNDAGRLERGYAVDRPLREVTDWVVAERDGMLPGVYIPQWGPSERWTKGECFVAMDCNAPRFRSHPQVQAGFSVWQAHDASRDFVAQWAKWCLTPQAVADERIDPTIPDSPNFIEHRHDQSVLTNLVVKHGLRLFGDPYEVIAGPGSMISTDIGTLADRICRRRWAIRRRLAREALGQHDFGSSRGVIRKVRRATRYMRELGQAWRAYPSSSPAEWPTTSQ